MCLQSVLNLFILTDKTINLVFTFLDFFIPTIKQISIFNFMCLGWFHKLQLIYIYNNITVILKTQKYYFCMIWIK